MIISYREKNEIFTNFHNRIFCISYDFKWQKEVKRVVK